MTVTPDLADMASSLAFNGATTQQLEPPKKRVEQGQQNAAILRYEMHTISAVKASFSLRISESKITAVPLQFQLLQSSAPVLDCSNSLVSLASMTGPIASEHI